MFQIEQLYTAVSRAKAIEQLVLLTPGKPEPPSERYSRTFIYVVRSPHTSLEYFGHSTDPKGPENYFKTLKKDRKRTCRHVIDAGDAYIKKLEDWPCATLLDAEAREHYYSLASPNAINKVVPRVHRLVSR